MIESAKSSVPLFRGMVLNDLLQCIEEQENASGLFYNKNRKEKLIFLEGFQQASVTTLLERYTNIRSCARTFLITKSIRKVLLPISKSTIIADQFRVHNNIVAFYENDDLVLKMHRKSGFRSFDDLKNEVSVIKEASTLNFLNVPQIILDNSSSPNGLMPAVWYKYIKGVIPSSYCSRLKKESIIRLYLNTLLKWYEHHGVTMMHPGSMSYEKLSYDDLINNLWNEKESEAIIQATEKVQKMGLVMPVSMIQGDASLNNCIVNKSGELVVLDWELSCIDYIIKDVAKLVSQGGENVKTFFVEWLFKTINQKSKNIPIDIQIDYLNVITNFRINDKIHYFKKMVSSDALSRKIFELKKSVLNSAHSINSNQFFSSLQISISK